METKKCTKCKETLLVEKFAKKGFKKDGTQRYQSGCKACRAKWFQKHYEEQGDYYKDKAKKKRIVTQEWYSGYKKTLSCGKCGFDHPAALVFHHRNKLEKTKEVSLMIGDGKKKMLEEIAKCDVLCSNCHRILHYEERHGLVV
jgi:hypothetical protein